MCRIEVSKLSKMRKQEMLSDSEATFGKNKNVLLLVVLQSLYKNFHYLVKIWTKIVLCKNHKRKFWLEKENQATCQKKKKNLERENLREKDKLSISCSSSLPVIVVTLNTKSIPIYFSIISSFVQSWGLLVLLDEKSRNALWLWS